jgi:hypothetical protein
MVLKLVTSSVGKLGHKAGDVLRTVFRQSSARGETRSSLNAAFAMFGGALW